MNARPARGVLRRHKSAVRICMAANGGSKLPARSRQPSPVAVARQSPDAQLASCRLSRRRSPRPHASRFSAAGAAASWGPAVEKTYRSKSLRSENAVPLHRVAIRSKSSRSKGAISILKSDRVDVEEKNFDASSVLLAQLSVYSLGMMRYGRINYKNRNRVDMPCFPTKCHIFIARFYVNKY